MKITWIEYSAPNEGEYYWWFQIPVLNTALHNNLLLSGHVYQHGNYYYFEIGFGEYKWQSIPEYKSWESAKVGCQEKAEKELDVLITALQKIRG